MSYNVDTWKTKKIENLRVPVASLFKHERRDWHPKTFAELDGRTTFRVMESCYMSGVIIDNLLRVVIFECHGEGSGTALDWIFEPALKDSTGEFIASCVWEGGDSINQLRVKDGTVQWVDIEI